MLITWHGLKSKQSTQCSKRNSKPNSFKVLMKIKIKKESEILSKKNKSVKRKSPIIPPSHIFLTIKQTKVSNKNFLFPKDLQDSIGDQQHLTLKMKRLTLSINLCLCKNSKRQKFNTHGHKMTKRCLSKTFKKQGKNVQTTVNFWNFVADSNSYLKKSSKLWPRKIYQERSTKITKFIYQDNFCLINTTRQLKP